MIDERRWSVLHVAAGPDRTGRLLRPGRRVEVLLDFDGDVGTRSIALVYCRQATTSSGLDHHDDEFLSEEHDY